MVSNQPIQTQEAITQPVIPPVPDQPLESKPKLSKWFIVAIVIIFLIIASCATAFFLSKNQNTKTQTAQAIPTQTVAKGTATLTPVPNPTANWNTFTKKYLNFGYSIMYPSNFSLNPPGSQGGTGATEYIGDSNASIATYLSGQQLQNNQIVITLIALAENIADMQTLANRIGGDKKDSNGNSIENLPFQSVTVGGIKSIKVTNENIVNYGIPVSGNIIWFAAHPASSSQIQIFEQMISTFKFIP